MTTQGISLMTSKVSEKMTAKSVKANESAFDSFMTDRATKANVSQQENKKSENAVDTETAKTSERAENSLSLKKGSAETARKPETPEAKMPVAQDTGEEITDPEIVVYQMITLIKDVFGFDLDTLQNIMRDTGMTLKEALGTFPDSETAETFQNLVMNVHGITDKAAFLTNDVLVKEMSMLEDQFRMILANALHIPAEELAKVDASAFTPLVEQLENMIQPETGMMNTTTENGQEELPEMMLGNQEQGFEVIVEDTSGENSGAQTETFERRQDAAPVVHNEEPVAAANLFTERLAEAFEASAGDESVQAKELMTHIVDQVVNQVKIRVMPETTNMEIMLHPESLGRVNLQVSATAGVTKATLIVENLMAKEALESQMITLKETFAQQGMKVEAVEVTVSEFGLNQENRQAQQEQKNGSRHRRFRTEDESADTDADTVQAEKRDINSVVDYTA